MGLLAVLGLLAALFLVGPLKPGGSSAASNTPVNGAAAAGTPAAAGAPADITGVAPAPTAPVEDAVEAEVSFDEDGDLVPGVGFPPSVVKALNADKLAVLFIYDPDGLSDEELKGYTKRLEDDRRLKLILVEESEVAAYSRVIGGADVDRSPALLIVSPPVADGGIPEASVSYGFRRPKSVRQAVDDALFDGPNVPPYPR